MIKTCPICSNQFVTDKRVKVYCGIECAYKGQFNTPEDFWSKVDIRGDNECWEWKAGLSKYGYGQIHYNRKVMKAHRLAYILTHGPIPDGLDILHSCNNRSCCNAKKHLRPGTDRDNADDRVKVGHVTSGETNARAKFTTSQILEIRSLFQEGILSKQELATKFNTTSKYIQEIHDRRRWKHI